MSERTIHIGAMEKSGGTYISICHSTIGYRLVKTFGEFVPKIGLTEKTLAH